MEGPSRWKVSHNALRGIMFDEDPEGEWVDAEEAAEYTRRAVMEAVTLALDPIPHDPMCPSAYSLECQCDLIRRVRLSGSVHSEQLAYERGVKAGYAAVKQAEQDILAKCIAVVEELPWSSGNWLAVDERAAILADLRALRDQS